MYCKECGRFLAGTENFCSNCGTKVEKIIEKSVVKNESIENIEKESIKIISPIDDMVWDLKEFPSRQPRKTEDTEFNWNSGDMFLHKEMRKEEPFIGMVEEFNNDEQKINHSFEYRSDRKTASNLEVPEIFKKKEDKIEEPVFEETVEIEKPSFLRDDKSRGVVTRNTAPYNRQIFEEENVVEIEQPSSGGIAVEITQEKDSDVKVEKVVVDEPATSLFDEIAPEVVAKLQEADSVINEEKKQIDKFYTFNKKKEEFQKLLDKEYEKIEGKVEKGGLETGISSFMDVETGKDVEQTSQIEEMVKARELFFDDPVMREYMESLDKQEVESEPVEELFDIDCTPVVEEDEAKVEEAEELEEPEQVTEDDTPSNGRDDQAAEVVFEPEDGESLVDVLKEQEAVEESTEEKEEFTEEVAEDVKEVEKAEAEETEEKVSTEEETPEVEAASVDSNGIATVIIDPAEAKKNATEKLAAEFFDDDEEEEKKGKGLIFVIIILIIFFGGLMATRFFMPDTVISKQMDHYANVVVEFVKDILPNEEKEAQEERTSLVEDKTDLIEQQSDKNLNGNVEKVFYDNELKYSNNKEYAFSDLADAKDIQKNFWYEKDGKKYYYDEEIVGTLMAFASQKNQYMRSDEKGVFALVDKEGALKKSLESEEKSEEKVISELGIGDIKVGGDAYFVWVSEKTGKGIEKKIYKIKESPDKTLLLVDFSRI